MKTTRSAVMTFLVLAAAACGDNATSPTPPPPAPPPPPPPPGSANAMVALTTPNSDDGAVIVRLNGPGISNVVSSSDANLVYTKPNGEQEARVILVGNLSAGALFTFRMPSGAQPSGYTATVEQVASRTDALRSATTGYQLTVSAAP